MPLHCSTALLVAKTLIVLLSVGVLSMDGVRGALQVGLSVFSDSSCTQPYNQSAYDFLFDHQTSVCTQAAPNAAMGITAIEAYCGTNTNLTTLAISYYNTSIPPVANYTPQGSPNQCPKQPAAAWLSVNVASRAVPTPCSRATFYPLGAAVYVQGVCVWTDTPNSAIHRVATSGTAMWGAAVMAAGLLLHVLF